MTYKVIKSWMKAYNFWSKESESQNPTTFRQKALVVGIHAKNYQIGRQINIPGGA